MRLNTILIWLAIVALAAVAGGTYYYQDKAPSERPPIFQGVGVGNEYTGTTTQTVLTVKDTPIKDGWGALGSLTVTVAGEAEYLLFNESSSLLTWDNFPTSTRLLAEIPANLAVGTYTFDIQFTEGLYLDVINGSLGSTTITFR